MPKYLRFPDSNVVHIMEITVVKYENFSGSVIVSERDVCEFWIKSKTSSA